MKYRKFLGWVLSQISLAAICYIAYKYGLNDVFTIELTFIHWISIVIISNCVIPHWQPIKFDSSKDGSDEVSKPFSKFYKRNDRQGS